MSRKNRILNPLSCRNLVLAGILLLFSACQTRQPEDLRVLQMNLWHAGTAVPDGFTGIAGIIEQLSPDVVLLCEISNRDQQNFIPRLLDELWKREQPYFGESLDMSVGILSRYALEDVSSCFTLENGSRPMIKGNIRVNGQVITIYSAHLDYTHYECYLPRGYSGTTWQKIEAPVTDPEIVLEANRLSFRDEAIEAFLADAEKEIQKGHLILLGGDFNEPSHLDWQEETKDLWDHHGVVIEWDCSRLLIENGYKDTYRELFPDVVNYPAFTFPSANPAVEISKLAWAPEADERDRIDFIYYYPSPSICLRDASVVGPSQTIIRGVQHESDSKDSFIEPKGIWPTDHKAMWAVFSIYSKK